MMKQQKRQHRKRKKVHTRGLRDALVTKKRSNTMYDTLSDDKNSSEDNVGDNSACTSSEAKEEKENSFDKTCDAKKMSIDVIEEEINEAIRDE